MPVFTRTIGNNVLFMGGHRKRVVGAVGPDVFQFYEDFTYQNLPAADAPGGATVTLVEAGAGETTLTLPDISGGALLITTDAAENDGANVQWLGESFSMPTGTRFLYFGIRAQMNDVVQSDFLAGICITDTDLLGGMTDGLYFRKVDGSAAVSCVAEKNSLETAAASTFTWVINTYAIFEFVYEVVAGVPTVYCFVDGVSLGTITGTNICDDELLRPSIHVLTGEANACTATIDWIRVVQIGR